MTAATDLHASPENEDLATWAETNRRENSQLLKISAVLFVVALAIFMVLMVILSGSGADTANVVHLNS